MPRWLTQQLVRELALALPEAHEHQHRGRPDLRVKNKIFATLPEDGRTVNVKTTPTDLDLLVSTTPETFRDVWGGTWVGVDLGRISRGRLRGLLIAAWRLAAPKRLRDAHADMTAGIS